MKRHDLKSKSVFLSASIPHAARDERFRRVPDANVKIAEAVMALSRALFVRNGRLIFGGHPTISPLVAGIAAEYFSASPVSTLKPVSIYQSRAFEGFVPDQSLAMFRYGLANLRWTDAHYGERFNPDIKRRTQCANSLRLMRSAMLVESDPIACVAIGGMEGVLQECQMFSTLYPDRPIFTFATTGGAASQMLENISPDSKIKVVDHPVLERLPELLSPERGSLYTLAAQSLVQTIFPDR